MQQYVPDDIDGGTVSIVPPAIDPLSPKNMALSPDDAAFVCDQFGIDPERPLICQVSRFDPWKDPIGVIDAYRIVNEEIPEVQLALVGSMATDDPEGWEFFQHTFATPTATPTSRSSTTSTTSARSRSTRSSRRPTSACRSRSARGSA